MAHQYGISQGAAMWGHIEYMDTQIITTFVPYVSRVGRTQCFKGHTIDACFFRKFDQIFNIAHSF